MSRYTNVTEIDFGRTEATLQVLPRQNIPFGPRVFDKVLLRTHSFDCVRYTTSTSHGKCRTFSGAHKAIALNLYHVRVGLLGVETG